jgi:hypothetical protein
MRTVYRTHSGPLHAVEPFDMFWLTATLPEEYYEPLSTTDDGPDADIAIALGGIVFATILLMALIGYGLLMYG